MLKKVLYTVLLLMAILFTVGYLRYNPTVNFNGQVPASAKTVVRINLRAIEYAFLKEALTSFSSPSSFSKKKKKKSTSLLKAVGIPTDILFYSTTDYKQWVSTAITIKDVAVLTKYLTEQKFKKQADTIFVKNGISCVINKNALKIVVGKIPADVFKETKYLTEADASLSKLKNTKGLVALASEKDEVSLVVNDKQLTIVGSLSVLSTVFNAEEVAGVQGAIGQLSGSLNTGYLKANLNDSWKAKFNRLTNLSLDSVLAKSSGRFTASLDGFKVKKDTVVTYDYDDDFNKIETKTIEESSFPLVDITVKGVSLYEYLAREKAIQQVANVNRFVLMPLFTMQAENKENGLRLFTKAATASDNAVKTNFMGYLNLKEYQKQAPAVFKLHKKWQSVTAIDIKVNNAVKLNAVIHFNKGVFRSLQKLTR